MRASRVEKQLKSQLLNMEADIMALKVDIGNKQREYQQKLHARHKLQKEIQNLKI